LVTGGAESVVGDKQVAMTLAEVMKNGVVRGADRPLNVIVRRGALKQLLRG
jgi:hypothetical protein